MKRSSAIAERIRIVLIATTHPGNIGAAARAMKTMGLSKLYLVRPKLFPHVEATARASGADDILANTVVVDNLRDAICDCRLVVGASARQRDLPLTLLDSREAAALAIAEIANSMEVKAVAADENYNAAFIFGRESNGLHNDELLQCNYHVYIPANPVFSSLNVASAVQVIAYEIMMATARFASSFNPSPTSHAPHDIVANAAEVQAFYRHLEQVLIELEFLRPQKSKRLMTRVQRLFNRVRLEHLEVSALRGVLATIEKKLKLINTKSSQ